MTPRALARLSVLTTPEAEEAVSEALLQLFNVTPVTHQNTQTRRTTVSIFGKPQDLSSSRRRRILQTRLSLIRASGLDLGSGRVRSHRIKVEDWAHAWKRHFKPWRPGAGLLIKPSWSRMHPARHEAVMVLDPGLSFGTGHHATTRFCLKQLLRSRNATRNQSFLDIGTGSGILALAAALVGYQPVQAFDFDPEAIRAARQNLKQNNQHTRVRLHRADLSALPYRSEHRFDVVCANLIDDLLIQHRRRILNRVSPHGALILAGILVEQFPRVEAAYRKEGWILVRARTESEWRSGLFRKHAPASRSRVAASPPEAA